MCRWLPHNYNFNLDLSLKLQAHAPRFLLNVSTGMSNRRLCSKLNSWSSLKTYTTCSLSHLHWSLSFSGHKIFKSSLTFLQANVKCGSRSCLESDRICIQNLITSHHSCCYLLSLSHRHLFPRLLRINPLTQQSSTFLGPCTSFVENNFSIDWR